MARLPEIEEANLSTEQKRMFDEVSVCAVKCADRLQFGSAMPNSLIARLDCRICSPRG